MNVGIRGIVLRVRAAAAATSRQCHAPAAIYAQWRRAAAAVCES